MKSFGPALAWVGAVILGGAALFGACARPTSPPGGPRDIVPPMIASTWPDTFEIIEPTRDPVRIVFSERISERPTQGTLDNAVQVSPFTGEHTVKHTRSGLEIDVIGGFQPDLVYRIRILPIVKDLFTNTMEGPFELVFSTGAQYETNVIAGIVEDRITGEVIEGARVEARGRGEEDPPVYVATTDSSGVFALRYLPAASYDISLYQDMNRNEEPDFSESQGTAEGIFETLPPEADTVILRQVRLLRPDTLPARLIRVEAHDSLTVRLAFDDFLDAEGTLGPFFVQIAPEEGPDLEIDRLVWPRQVDSLRAVADSIAAEERRIIMVDSLQIVVDSLNLIFSAMETAGDTLGVDSVGTVLDRLQARIAPPDPREEPDPEEVQGPPPILPRQEFFVLLAEPLVPDRLFNATVSGVANINGLGGGGGEASFTWEPPEPPPEEEVPDTAAALPDTAGVSPDTSGVPPDTMGVPPDTSGIPPDTSGVPPDTLGAPPDTAGVPPDTSGSGDVAGLPSGGGRRRLSASFQTRIRIPVQAPFRTSSPRLLTRRRP